MVDAAKVFEDVGLVIAAGGSGRRFGVSGANKLLADFAGAPVLAHSLRRFCHVLPPRHTVLVASASAISDFAALLRTEGLLDTVILVEGGAERQDSVFIGLMALPASVEMVAIHDGARPRTKLELLVRCLQTARLHGTGVAAVDVRDTIKRATPDEVVVETVDREVLRATETPQVFRRNVIADAYRRLLAAGGRVTDDAQAVELAGGRVRLVVHGDDNRKVTFASDLPQADF